jgi:hypothetical protein
MQTDVDDSSRREEDAAIVAAGLALTHVAVRHRDLLGHKFGKSDDGAWHASGVNYSIDVE